MIGDLPCFDRKRRKTNRGIHIHTKSALNSLREQSSERKHLKSWDLKPNILYIRKTNYLLARLSPMKNFLIPALLLFSLASCKVSNSVTADHQKNPSEELTVDQITKSSDLAEKKTFQLIETKDVTKNIAQLNRIFEKKLIENGFSLVEENPDLLVQSVIASVNFEKEDIGNSGTTTPGGYFGPSPTFHSYTESGQYGKVIFLIQDAKTNEVVWMGTGTGILTANEVLNTKTLKSALDQLMAELR